MSVSLSPSEEISESGNQPDPILHLPHQDWAGPGIRECLMSEQKIERVYEWGLLDVNPGPSGTKAMLSPARMLSARAGRVDEPQKAEKDQGSGKS